MRVGIHIPQWARHAARDEVIAAAHTIEDSGFDGAWVADHIVFPAVSRSSYPYARQMPMDPSAAFLDGLTLLAAVALITERISLGTSVLIAPLRQPLALAKAVSTLDVLSEGRVVLGVGVGWLEEEYRALNVPFERRGRILDEQLSILKRVWEAGSVDADGARFQFPTMMSFPRPQHEAGPPVWVGGNSDAAMRRVVRLGDGWHAVGASPDLIGEGRMRLEQLATEHGRDPSSIGISTSMKMGNDPERTVTHLVRLAALGVEQVVLHDSATDPARWRDRVARFAEAALAPLRGQLGEPPAARTASPLRQGA